MTQIPVPVKEPTYEGKTLTELKHATDMAFRMMLADAMIHFKGMPAPMMQALGKVLQGATYGDTSPKADALNMALIKDTITDLQNKLEIEMATKDGAGNA